MEWINYFQRIALINLADRFDRLYDTIQIMDEYKIPFERFDAIRHENGALGLGITMKRLFNECLENDIQNVLVLEDDVIFCSAASGARIFPLSSSTDGVSTSNFNF